ncbi:MAG: NAD-dependent epimerase/dehydratase family protein [Candidatus Paceibacterota bacterium]
MNKKIGFIGQGWIGKNYADDFEKRGFEVVRYSLEEPHVNNKEKIKECEIVFIAVPTPTKPEGFDDSILRQAVKLVGEGKTAIIKSTITPGTTESIQEENPGIYVMHSPEFLTESTAAYDASNPTRSIIGLPKNSEEFKMRAREVFSVLPYAPYKVMCSSKEAELIKYGGNCWFYFKVIFINMLYDLSQELGCQWETIQNTMAADPRIGRTHLNPIHQGGRGAGGHCFIKDFAAFSEIYKKHIGDDLGTKVLESLEDKNADLLVKSGKDLDLLAGVYGEKFKKEKERTRCLVTGGAGFIGSNLVDELIKQGNEVVVIDNLSAGKIENVNPEADFHKVDIRNLEEIKPLFKNIDYVFHVAALPRVPLSILDPITFNDINVNGTLNVLMAAKEAGVKKLIYSASSSAYGDQDSMPLKETMTPDPLSPYALQKYAGEKYCRLFSQLYNLPTVCLRYFNVYGNRQPLEGAYSLVMGIFTRQRLAGEPMTIIGDGEQRRDFTNVADVVRANILAATSDKVGKGEVINIGRGNNYSVNELAKIIGGPIVYLPPRIEPRETLADNSLAKELLNWEPTVDLPVWLEEYKKEMGL